MTRAMNVRAMNKQRGMTLISWVVVIVFIGFQAMLAIKILPVYMTDSSIKKLWSNLETDPSLVGAPPKKIREVVLKRLKINNVYALNKKDIKIKKVKGNFIVSVVYEPRGTVIGTLDYIMTFKHEATVRAR